MRAKIDHRPHYSHSDYEKWEGDWELIQGMPYAMSPSPSYRHQEVSGYIHDELLDALSDCPECRPVFAVDWIVSDDTVLQPDNIVVCGHKTEERFVVEPPALIFEVLSPSTSYRDRHLKYQIFEAEGVAHYVLVDIEAKMCELFSIENSAYRKREDRHDGRETFNLGPCQIDVDFGRFWR